MSDCVDFPACLTFRLSARSGHRRGVQAFAGLTRGSIARDNPVQNAFILSFNGIFRDELLNETLSSSLKEPARRSKHGRMSVPDTTPTHPLAISRRWNLQRNRGRKPRPHEARNRLTGSPERRTEGGSQVTGFAASISELPENDIGLQMICAETQTSNE